MAHKPLGAPRVDAVVRSHGVVFVAVIVTVNVLRSRRDR
jgi:hypothetical protein